LLALWRTLVFLGEFSTKPTIVDGASHKSRGTPLTEGHVSKLSCTFTKELEVKLSKDQKIKSTITLDIKVSEISKELNAYAFYAS